MVEYEQTQQLLTEMGLTTAAALLDAKLDEAARNEDMTYLRSLNQLLIEEERARKRRSQQTRLKLSKLPFRKTLEEFDFDFQPSIDKDQINELGTLVFAERNENVLFLGPPRSREDPSGRSTGDESDREWEDRVLHQSDTNDPGS
jgi:DNA replication protein DnaC